MTVCFADLVGFTRLGERIEPDRLGAIAGRLAAMATEIAEPPVRLVKTIGDAAMLVSPEAVPVLDAALRLVEAAEGENEGSRRCAPVQPGARSSGAGVTGTGARSTWRAGSPASRARGASSPRRRFAKPPGTVWPGRTPATAASKACAARSPCTACAAARPTARRWQRCGVTFPSPSFGRTRAHPGPRPAAENRPCRSSPR